MRLSKRKAGSSKPRKSQDIQGSEIVSSVLDPGPDRGFPSRFAEICAEECVLRVPRVVVTPTYGGEEFAAESELDHIDDRDDEDPVPVIRVTFDQSDKNGDVQKAAIKGFRLETDLLRAIGRCLTAFPTITSLRLEDCGLATDQLSLLAKLVVRATTLRELSLDYNTLPGGDLGPLLDPRARLENLSLRWCGVLDGGALSLAGALAYQDMGTSPLLSLNLTCNSITCEGARHLAEDIADVDEIEVENSGSRTCSHSLANIASISSSMQEDTCTSSSSKISDDTDSSVVIQQKKQTTFTNYLKRRSSFEFGGVKDAAITQVLTYMICKDNLPLSTVDKTGFQKFMKIVCPLYKIPSRPTITKLLENQYFSIKQIIISKLATAKYVAITADICTVLNSTRSFLVITAHFVDESDSTFQCVCLGSIQMTQSHTGEHIAEELAKSIKQFGIEKGRIVSVTTDGASNMTKAADIFLSAQQRIVCFAHILNLLVQGALSATKDFEKILTQVKRIVTYFKHSVLAMDALREQQKKMGKSEGSYLYLSQDIETRWNSTHDMLDKFQKLSPVVAQILASVTHKDGPQMLAGAHLEVVSEVIQVLNPFKEATREISGDKYITGSTVLPIVHCINESLKEIKSKTKTTIATNLIVQLEDGIQKRLLPLENNVLLCIATVLDPRFKRLYTFSPVSNAAAITKLCQDIKDMTLRLGIPSVEPDEGNLLPLQHQLTKDSIWDKHEERIKKNCETSIVDSQSQGTVPLELKLYFSTSCIQRNSEPVKFWTSRITSTPALANTALKYLTVVGSSVASERAVSALNHVLSERRSRLTSEHVNERLFLACVDDKYW